MEVVGITLKKQIIDTVIWPALQDGEQRVAGEIARHTAAEIQKIYEEITLDGSFYTAPFPIRRVEFGGLSHNAIGSLRKIWCGLTRMDGDLRGGLEFDPELWTNPCTAIAEWTVKTANSICNNGQPSEFI